jgi:tRNA pseudouridine55 synthase
MLTFEALEQCLSEGGEEALDDLLLPMDSAVSYLSRVNLSNVAADDILFGRFVENTTDDDTERLVRLFCESSEQFLGLGNVKNSRIVPFRLINTSELNQTK